MHISHRQAVSTSPAHLPNFQITECQPFRAGWVVSAPFNHSWSTPDRTGTYAATSSCVSPSHTVRVRVRIDAICICAPGGPFVVFVSYFVLLLDGNFWLLLTMVHGENGSNRDRTRRRCWWPWRDRARDTIKRRKGFWNWFTFCVVFASSTYGKSTRLLGRRVLLTILF